MLLNSSDQRLQEETRIVYHIDDEETPYLVKLNMPPTKVTLADFKNALNLPRTNYKFFFKSMDDDFGVVKEEIVDDQARLPMFKGRVVSWLVSAEDSVLSSAESSSQCTEISVNRMNVIRKQLHQKTIQNNNRPVNPLDLMYETSISESDVLSDDFDTCTEIDSTVGPSARHVKKLNASKLCRPMHPHHHHHHQHDCRCESSSVLTSDVDSTTFVDSDDDDDDYQTHEDDYEDLDENFDRLTQISTTTEDTSVSKAAENREKRRKRMLLQAKMQHQQIQMQQAFNSGFNKLSNINNLPNMGTLSTNNNGNNGKMKNKNPYAKLNRSLSRTSSTSSITDSTMSLNIITVTLQLTSVNFLGISIVGQSYKNGDGGIYVGSIMSGGAVAADGRIDPGDMILQVNDINFENLSNDKAVEVLREAVSRPGPIKLVVAKCCFPQSNNGCNSVANNSNIGLTSADILAMKKDEPVRPIDPRAWVEHTKIAQGLNETEYPTRPESVSTITSFANGVKEPNYNSIQLTTKMDMLFIARAMAAPDSGLEVKDRMWLKITIPNAFLGSEVVDWLYNQVQGFADRREAKKYASAMLKQNYIRHTMNKSSFSEQCYYTFGDLILIVTEMDALNLNPNQVNGPTAAQWVDTVHYGVFGAAPNNHASETAASFEPSTIMNVENGSVNRSNVSIPFDRHLNSNLTQSAANHMLATQQMLMQSRQLANNLPVNQLSSANVYSDTYQANGSSSNSSETQSSLNTQSTRDTAIGLSSNGAGSRATLQDFSLPSNTNPTNTCSFAAPEMIKHDYAIDHMHSGMNRSITPKNIFRSIGIGK